MMSWKIQQPLAVRLASVLCIFASFSVSKFLVVAIVGLVAFHPTTSVFETRVEAAPAVMLCQDEASSGDEAAIDAELKAKALRYHQALQRRPAPGFLFDRFFDAWVEFSTIAELEQFLRQQVDTHHKTNDQVLLALFYSKQGDDVKALAQFQTALATDPGSAATWFEKAAVAARTLDFDTALQDLAKAAELQTAASSPDKELGLNIAKQQASLLVRSARLTEAKQAWETLIAANPSDELLLEDIVEQQIGEGLFEQALGTTEKLLAITKDPYQLVKRRMRQGDILQRSGKQPEALQVYGETLPRVGRDTWLERELVAQIVELFRREDNLTGLKEQFEKLLAAEPDRLALQKGLAKTLSEIGQPDDAIAALQKIVELTPGDRSNRENLIAALAKAGNLDGAVAQQEALIGQFPTDAELSIALAELQKKRSQDALAQTAVLEFLAKSGNSEAAYLRAARVLDGFGLTDETRRIYVECLERFAQSAVAREAYGSWLYQRNDKAVAIQLWLKMAAGADKQDLLRLARLLAQRNEHAAVLSLLQGRLAEFDSDSIYLGQLIDSAIALKQFPDTVPWLRRRAMVSQSAIEVENTIAQATIVFRRMEQPATLLDALKTDTFQSDGTIRIHGIGAACLLSELMELGGDSTNAEQILEQFEAALNGTNDPAKNLELLGTQRIRLLTMRQDWAKAAETAKKLVELPGGRQSGHLKRLVELYMRDGQPEQAVAWVAQWKQSSPGNVTPWVTEAQLLSRLNREEESLRVLRQASRRFPQDIDLATMLAEKYMSVGQAREAERIYWRQFEQTQDPSERLQWVEQLARVKSELGQTDELVALFRERQKSNPESIEPLLSLALIYREMDNYEDRRAVLMEASRKQPDNLQLLLETARLEEASGDWQDSLETLQRALPLDPSGKVARQLAKSSFTYGETQRGLELLQTQLNSSGISPRDVEILIDSLLQADQWEVARALLQPQLVRWPDDWRLSYIQGVIEQHLEANDSAKEIFLKLLTVDNDLPGLSGINVGSRYGLSSYGLPKTLETFYELQYRYDEPLAHEEQRSFGGRFLMLPSDPRTCQQYALWHLVFMNQDAEDVEDDRLAIMQKMGAGRFDNVDLYFDLLIGTSGSFGRSTPDLSDKLIERYSNRKDFWLLYAFLSLENDAPQEDENLVRAISSIEPHYPSLALACVLRVIEKAPESASDTLKSKAGDLLKPLKEKRVEDSDYLLMQTAYDFLGRNPEDLPADVRGLQGNLAELFAQWHREVDTASNLGSNSNLTNIVIASAVRSKSTKMLVEILEHEMDRAAKNTTNQSAVPYLFRSPYSRYGYDETLISLLPFPPTQYLEISSAIEVLSEHLQRTEERSGLSAPTDTSETTLTWLNHSAEQTSRPFLKAILQLMSGRMQEESGSLDRAMAYTELQSTLTSFLEANPQDWNALLLAASLATHQERWLDAAAMLERSAALPLSPDQRKLIDSATVAVAVNGKASELDQPAQEPLVAAARNAALRLRRHQLGNAQSMELMLAMETLQLNEEAGDMESRLAQSNPAAGSVAGRVVPMGSNPFHAISGGPERIVELLRDDKKDAAFRLLTQDINSLAKQRLALFFQDEDDYELRQFVSMIKSLELSEALLEHLAAVSPDKLDSLGFAHELFGDSAQALAYYQKYVDANPGRTAVRFRCLLIKLRENPEHFAQHLQELDSFDAKVIREIGPVLLGQMTAGPLSLPLTFEQRLQLIENLLARAEQDAQEKPENAAWLEAAWPVLTRATSLATPKPSPTDTDSNGETGAQTWSLFGQLNEDVEQWSSQLAPLYQTGRAFELNRDDLPTPELQDLQKKRMEARERRIAVHDRLSNLLLQSPPTASEAFSHWLALREAQGNVDPIQAVALAKTVLERSANFRGATGGSGAQSIRQLQKASIQQMQAQMRYSSAHRHEYFDDSDERHTTPMRTPVQYLSRQLAAENSVESRAQISEIVQMLRSSRRTELATELQRRYELQTAPPDQFASVFGGFASEEKKRRSANTEDYSELFMEIYQDRKLEVDLLPALLEMARSMREQNQWDRAEQIGLLFGKYVAYRSKSVGPAFITTALAAYAEALCGGTEQQGTLIEKYGNKPNLPPGRGDGAAYSAYVASLERFGVFSELGLPIMIEVARFKANDHLYVRHRADEYAQYLVQERDADKIIAYLDLAGFLNGVERFDPIALDATGQSTVLGSLMYGLRGETFVTRRKLLNALKDREPTFGTRLFIKMIESNGSSFREGDIHQVLKVDLDNLAALPDEKITQLVNMIQEIVSLGSYYSSGSDFNSVDPEVQAVLSRGMNLTAQFEKFMAAKSLKDLDVGGDFYEFREYAGRILLLFIEHQKPKEFALAFRHFLELASKELGVRRQVEISQFVDPVMSQATSKKGLATFAAVAWLATTSDHDALDVMTIVDRDLAESFVSELAAVTKGQDAEAIRQGLDTISNNLATLTSEADVSSFHYLFLSALIASEFDRDKLTAVVDWSLKARSQSNYPSLAQQWWIAAQLAISKQEVNANTQSTVNVDELRTALLATVRSETQSPTSRSVAALTLLSSKLPLDTADLTMSMELLTRLLKNHPPNYMKPWMTTVIKVLSQMEDEDQLKEISLPFAMALEKQAADLFGGYSFDSQPDLIQALRLYHRLGRPAGVTAVVRAASGASQSPEIVAELTRLGYANLAWAQLNRNWDSIQLAHVFDSAEIQARKKEENSELSIRFDSELESKLDELTRLANHPGTKFLVRLYVSVLRDTDDETKRPVIGRAERLANLAGQFPDLSFSSRDERLLALLLLSLNKDLSPRILAAITEAAGNLRPFDIWQHTSDNELFSRNRRLLVTSVVIQLQRGECDGFDAMLADMDKLDEDYYAKEYLSDHVTELLSTELAARMEQIDADTLVSMTPKLLQLKSDNSHATELRGLLQLWYLIQDREKEFNQIIKSVKPSRGQGLFGSRTSLELDIDDLWEIALRMKPELLNQGPEERIKLVQSIWRLTKSGAEVGTAHFQNGVKESCESCRVAKFGLDAIEATKLLSAEELMVVGPELARIDSIDGEIWRQIGHRQMQLEQWEAAEGSLQRAISESRRASTAGTANRQVELAWVLSKLGKADEAKQVLSELKSTDLYGENPQRLTQLKTELQID